MRLKGECIDVNAQIVLLYWTQARGRAWKELINNGTTEHERKESEELIIGPTLYQESIEGPVRDLGIWGEYPVAIEYDEEPFTSEIVPIAYHV